MDGLIDWMDAWIGGEWMHEWTHACINECVCVNLCVYDFRVVRVCVFVRVYHFHVLCVLCAVRLRALLACDTHRFRHLGKRRHEVVSCWLLEFVAHRGLVTHSQVRRGRRR